MYERSLNGEWQCRQVGSTDWFDAAVPGGIYGDLRRADRIPDPLYGDNDLDVQWVADADWEYRRTIDVDESLLDHERIVLECDGLDTIAEVSVNGERVGSSRNMHVGQTFAVEEALGPGENTISVIFRSPTEYAQLLEGEHPYELPGSRYPHDRAGRQYIRKAQCHFGWDWGPALPTMGIYRDIRLVGHDGSRIEYVTTRQDHDTADGVEVTARVGIESPRSQEVDLSLAVADGETTESVALEAGATEATLSATLEDPDLWWPNGHGDQPLYEMTVVVSSEEGTDTYSERVGLRDVELVTETGDGDATFHFEVNGEPIFAKGANTIPLAPMYRDVTEERYEHFLESAAAANMNMLRVWGGGYYENDRFYELCDEKGLLVWQDFMFACGLYPATKDFLDSVEEEVRYQVRRLANHPSIALWCGNNENEEVLQSWNVDHPAHEQHVEDFEALYHDTIAPACREEDPSRTFWPGSPSSGADYEDPDDHDRGDIHYWDVWHSGEPVENYRDTAPRFVSEFGYQSFPSIDSLRSVLPEDQLNPSAPLMEHHQRDPKGNRILSSRIAETFRTPFDFEDFIYLTQIQQGRAMQAAIEHWRHQRPDCMGALFWQLNVLWPVVSWASMEYDGDWKAQQYMARRQFSPVMLSFHPTYECVSTNDFDEHVYEDISQQALWITNDTFDDLEGNATVQLWTLDGERLREETITTSCPAQTATELISVDVNTLPDGVSHQEVMVTAQYDGSAESYQAAGFFDRFKRLSLPTPELEWSVDGRDVTLTTDVASLYVECQIEDLDGWFSDNYFHVYPGQTKTITFSPRGEMGEEAIQQALETGFSIRSLRDTY
jgi:beta-mannosidase